MQDKVRGEVAGNLYRLYEERRPLYELALSRVNDALRAIAADRSLFTVSQQRRIRVDRGRVKEGARLLAKVQAPKYADRIKSAEDVFEQITDIAGTRITCNTVSDVERIVEGIKRSQTIKFPSRIPLEKTHEDYIVKPKPSGYRAVHLLVEVPVPHGTQFVDVICEVQIRTLLQHAWGELTHEDTFKPEVKVPTLVASLSKRLATTLAVLDEIAQDLRDELEKIESDPAVVAADDETQESIANNDDRPVPQPLFKKGVLAEVFEHVMERPLSIASNIEDRYRREFAKSRVINKKQLEFALTAARRATEGAFQEFPFVYDDVDILDGATVYGTEGDDGVLSKIRELGRRKANQVRLWTTFEDMYAPGCVYVGTVIRVTPRYALLQLPSGDSGILSARHLEQGTAAQANLEHFVAPGDSVRIEVVNGDAKEQRIEVRPLDKFYPRYRK